MAEIWDASGVVEDTAKDLLGQYHPEIATASFGYGVSGQGLSCRTRGRYSGDG